MLTEPQREDRRLWIGASDLARDATGLYGGTLAVLADKIHGSDWEGSPDTELGDWCEPHLLDWAGETLLTDYPISHIAGRQLLVEHVDATTHIRSTLDGLLHVTTQTGFVRYPVEAKYVGPGQLKEWSDDEPSAYAIVQINAQMDCLDADHGYVVAFLHGIGKRLYRVARDAELCAALRDRARYLWTTYIEPRVMPEVTDIVSMSEAHALRLPRFGLVPGKAVTLSPAHAMVADLMDLSGKAKYAEERFHDGLNNLMKMAMGDAEVGNLPDGSSLVRKEVSRTGYTVEPTTYVEMRRKKPRNRKDDNE